MPLVSNGPSWAISVPAHRVSRVPASAVVHRGQVLTCIWSVEYVLRFWSCVEAGQGTTWKEGWGGWASLPIVESWNGICIRMMGYDGDR